MKNDSQKKGILCLATVWTIRGKITKRRRRTHHLVRQVIVYMRNIAPQKNALSLVEVSYSLWVAQENNVT